MASGTQPANESIDDLVVVTQELTRPREVSESKIQVVISNNALGENPVTLICASCNQMVTTKVVREQLSHKRELASFLCKHGCCLCVPCIYCPRALVSLNHYCPNCNAFQGGLKP